MLRKTFNVPGISRARSRATIVQAQYIYQPIHRSHQSSQFCPDVP